jgi:hypothetical protein
MAHESSNPKVRVMFLVAVVSAISLGVFDQIFRSYYNAMMEEEESEKVLTVAPKQLIALRAAEQQRLTSAALPLDRAMKELAARGREDPALKDLSKADISPEASNDMGAVVGWGLLGNKAPEPAPAPVNDHAASSDAGTLMADGGGAVLATDAGFASDAKAAAPVPNPAPHGPVPEAGTH